MTIDEDVMTLPQGDVRLLDSDVARRLLASKELARLAYVAAVDHPGTRMARIAVRPTWVGVLDFQTRLPGGVGVEDFKRRGRS
ncbi:hypothetical protein [Streptosporangium sp. NPDC049304]|uniref:hypothetical protein n=1 Tax=Streptosporangium sp. NPDC049304 TaxID=3154830 RepID=UPI00342A9B0E